MAADSSEPGTQLKTPEPVNGLTKRVAGDVFDEWKTLGGHTFTVGFIIETLRSKDEVYRKLYGDRPIKDVTASNVGKGKGVMSEVLRCIVYFADSNNDSDIYTTILKIPGMESLVSANQDKAIEFDINNEKFVRKICECHQTEVDFYEHLAKTVDIPIPRVFKTLPWIIREAEGVIQMEDMTGRGKTLEIGDCLTIPQIKDIVRHLAHMHSRALASEDEEFNSWKGKHNDNQLFFTSLCEMLSNPNVLLGICGNREDLKPLISKYNKFAANPEYIKYACSQSWKDLNMSPVIVHGDCHIGNITWKLDTKGEITNEIDVFYDWQVSHEGSPMSDLARMITTSTDGCTRRQLEGFIFDFYHDLLEKEMKEVGRSSPYTVDQIKKAYNYMFLTQAYALTILPHSLRKIFKDDSPELLQARIDTAILKCKHALEDMDRLLTGELKDVFEKYGQ